MKRSEILEFQLLAQQLEQVQEFLNRTEQHAVEVADTITALERFAEQPSTQLLFPLANGVFGQATLGDDRTLWVNVGQGVVVKRTVAETINMVRTHLQGLQEQQALAAQQQEEFFTRLQALERAVAARQHASGERMGSGESSGAGKDKE